MSDPVTSTVGVSITSEMGFDSCSACTVSCVPCTCPGHGACRERPGSWRQKGQAEPDARESVWDAAHVQRFLTRALTRLGKLYLTNHLSFTKFNLQGVLFTRAMLYDATV